MEKGQRLYNPDAVTVFAERLDPHGFLRVPNMWFMLLMREESKYGKGIPASWWKFLFILWHELMFGRVGKPDWCATLSLRKDFRIRQKEASRWAHALAAAPSLFTVAFGTWPERDKTKFTYKSQADWKDWLGFYRGLLLANDWRSGQEIPVEEWEQKVNELVEEQTDEIKRAVEDGTFR